MSLIRRALQPRSEQRNDVSWSGLPLVPLNSQQPGTSTYSGVNVSTDAAMRHSVVWACVRLIAGTISQMPLAAMQSEGDRVAEVKPTPPLLTSPSTLVPTSVWVESVIASLLLRGNAYGLVTEYDPRTGVPLKIELLDPAAVQPERDKQNGRPIYILNSPDGRKMHERWPLGDMWHVPGLVMPGSFVGLSPIEYARQTIGQGLAAEKFGAQFFGEGGVPAAILSTELPVTEEQAATLKSRFLQAVKGRREPAVLGAGMKYQQISVAPEESQFLMTSAWSGEQICRVFGVAPEMLSLHTGTGRNMTYANREQKVADFLSFAINPWLNKVEEALTGLMDGDVQVKFSTGAILRADLQTRYQTYLLAAQVEQATGKPLLTTDEMRALENLPPLPPQPQPTGGPTGGIPE